MKRILFATPLLLLVAFLAPAASAQVTLGVYGDYTRLAQTSTNMAGVGVRVGGKIFPFTSLEGQLTYDFDQAFSENYSNSSGGVSVYNSNFKILKGLFGPTFETPGPVKFFVTAKGGFVDFMFNSNPNVAAGLTSSIASLRANNVDAMFYPGGGLIAYLGPVGLRLDVGDDMYFQSGAHNNLVVQFGPTIRF